MKGWARKGACVRTRHRKCTLTPCDTRWLPECTSGEFVRNTFLPLPRHTPGVTPPPLAPIIMRRLVGALRAHRGLVAAAGTAALPLAFTLRAVVGGGGSTACEPPVEVGRRRYVTTPIRRVRRSGLVGAGRQHTRVGGARCGRRSRVAHLTSPFGGRLTWWADERVADRPAMGGWRTASVPAGKFGLPALCRVSWPR